MALAFLDKARMGQLLSEMWKKELGTNQDPANGKWYERGADGAPTGLYGALTDDAITELLFDEAQRAYTPDTVVCNTATLDNRNGLSGKSTVELAYTYSDSVTTTHSTTDSIKVGIGHDVKGSATFLGLGADATTKFSVDYSHSWTDATSRSESKAHAFKQSVPIEVPDGKVYQVLLTAKEQKLMVPYRALIKVSGRTDTWFESQVGGHYNHALYAGPAFANIAKDHIGPESQCYGMHPKNPSDGAITQHGQLIAQQTADFVAKVYDITDSYEADKAVNVSRYYAGEDPPVQGTLVEEIPLTDE